MRIFKITLALASLSFAALLPCTNVAAQIGISGGSLDADRELNLPEGSPFHDPDMIYLEADELTNNEAAGILTAQGDVEGRYQDRTLRADKVIYSIKTGRVVAVGNVVLIDGSGAVQNADKLDLTSGLETGGATNLTSQLANGGVAGAAFATRTTKDGYQLYNAFYTACKPCRDSERKRPPSWQLKARQVSQDQDKNIIKYRDAVFELFGLPVFYTPYLAHPDPSAKRASGLLAPYVGHSGSKGLNIRAPYYWAVDDYSEVTFTPRIYQKVNPLLEIDARRLFYSGEISLNGSLTYGGIFDKDGNNFKDTDVFSPADEALLGKRLRSHLFANGHFDLTDKWNWGFTGQGVTDDLYLNRYDLDEPAKLGLYDGDSRRLVSQLYGVGQDDSFRFAISAYGFQSLRTTIREDDDADRTFNVSREDDSVLPIIAPTIDFSKYWTDPVLNGRLELSGNFTSLTRNIGSDYQRATAMLDWSRTFIAPAGIEMKPFANARYDDFSMETEEETDISFNRSLGQVGADIRWPLIRSGQNIDVIIEPRAQITQSFGDSKVDNFTTQDTAQQDYSVLQDSLDIDLDHNLLWSPNKATGHDLWQKGFRADVGGAVSTLWDDNRFSLFLGQSFASDYEDNYSATTGLSGDDSDLIGMAELELGNLFSINSRLRYDDDTNTFKRLDAGLNFNTERFRANARYYRIDNSASGLLSDKDAPDEEITSKVALRLTKNWSLQWNGTHDIDRDLTRRQEAGLVYEDDCMRIEFVYDERNYDSDVIRDSNGFGVRVSLFTLGASATD